MKMDFFNHPSVILFLIWQYFSNIGYCAETNCFLEELTGKETLDIIASLRGVTSDDREKAVIKWLSILGNVL